MSGERSLGAKIAVFLAAVIAWSHDAVGLTITNFIAKPIMAEFHVSKSLMGFVFSAQYIATIFGAILFGELADRLGRRIALVASVIWDGVATALTAVVPNFVALAALRIISGLGVSWGIGYAFLSEELSPKRRGLYGGLLHATFIIGYIISAVTVKYVYPHYGWRATYLIGLYPIPIILVLAKFLPESKVWQEYKTLEEKGGISVPRIRVKEVLVGKLMLITIISIITFWAAEIAYHAIVDWAPTMIQEVFGYSVEEASSLVIKISLLAAVILPAVGAISDYIGRRPAFSSSAVVGFVASLALLYFTLMVFNKNYAIASLYLIPIGFGSHALFGVWLSEIYPTKVRATATSFVFSVARGLSFGGFIVGLLASSVGMPLVKAMVSVAAISFVVMSVLAWMLPETKGKIITALE